MRYAENNQISHRQLYRQMLLSFLAPFLLCLPGEGSLLGKPGILGILAGALILTVYSFFLRRLTPWYADPVKMLGKLPGRILGIFFMGYVILAAAYLLSLMAEIVPSVLVAGIPGEVIAFFAALVCSMGSHKGMQRRGRMAEVSGGFVLGVVFLLLFLCVGQSRISYLKEMIAASYLAGKDIMRSLYGFLCAFSGISLLPFVLKEVEKRSTVGRPIVLGIFTLGGSLMGMLVLLPAVLGWQRLKSEVYPVLPLLAGADLPGNVLARFDVLWMAFLLYSLLFAVGSLFHYGNQIMGRAGLGTGRWWMPALVYVISITEVKGKGIQDIFGSYLGYVFVPGVILVQAGMVVYGNKKRQKKAAVACILFISVFLLGGCAAIEPEKRMYPLALGVDSYGEETELIYGMPDLPQATGQEKQEEDKNQKVIPISGKDFYEIEDIYNRSQEKYLDMSHLQVILIGDQILENGRWQKLLAYLDQDPFVGENVYLFRTEAPKDVLAWDSGGTSVGEYLTGLLENRLPERQKKGVTLRQVYHQWYQDGTMAELPVIRLENEEIQVYLKE